MSDQSLIETLKGELQNYTGIEVEQPNFDKLFILGDEENAIGIALQSIETEYKLNLNEYSKHYDKDEIDCEKISDLIISVIAGKARLQEFSKNGCAYKWKLQLQDKDGNWNHFGTTAILNLNFWTKPEIKYLQNNPAKIKRKSKQEGRL